MGGFFFEFEAIRTAFDGRCSAQVRCEDAAYYVTANLARLAHRVSDAEIEAAQRAFAAARAAPRARPAAAAAALGRAAAARGAPRGDAGAGAVAAADVRELLYARVHDCDHALAARGPVHELPDYNWVRTASYDYAV